MKLNSKLGRGSAVGALVLALVFSGAGVATADSPSQSTGGVLTEADRAVLIDSLNELGIDEATQASLVDKVDNGEALNSWTLTNPVESSSWEADGFKHVLVTFADGSRSLTSSQIPKEAPASGGITPFASTVCRLPDGPYPSGQSFSGCTIKRNSGGLTMSYTINGKTRGPRTGNALITGMSPVSCTFLAATSAVPTRYIGASSGKTAWAQGTCRVSLTGGAGVITYGLRVNVTDVIRAVEF